MGNCPRQLVVLSSVAAKRRKYWLLAASALAPLSLGVSEPTLAQCTGTPDNTICTPGGNFYSSGINVGGGPGDTLSVTLQPGVNVQLNPGANLGNAVNAANTTNSTTPPSAPITINANGIAANGITITNTGNPSGSNQSALRIQSSGAATITATNTTIDVAGPFSSGSSNNAIWAIVQGSNANAPVNATITWTGDHITSSGANSTDIQAENRGNGNASVDASGNLSGSGPPGGQFIGIIARSCSTLGNGTGCLGNTSDASVIYRSGTIDVRGGNFPGGIFANTTSNANPGSATVTTLPGTTIMVSTTDMAPQGIIEFAGNGAAMANVASTILINGNPTAAAGDFRFQPNGIQLQTNLGPAEVDYTGPGITVHGGGGVGIAAVSASNGATTASGPRHRECLRLRADRGRRFRRGRYPRRQRQRTQCNKGSPRHLDDRAGAGRCKQRVHPGAVRHRNQRERG